MGHTSEEKDKMIDKLSQSITAHPWRYILLFVVMALAVGSRLPTVEVDPEVKNQLPPTMPARVDLDRIEKLFGGTDMLMVTVVADDVLAPDTLTRVQTLSHKIKRMEQVDKVLSLFEMKDIKNAGDSMIVDPAVKQIPRTAADREALRADLKKNEMIYGSVVSHDFSATTVVALLSITAQDEVTETTVKKIIADTPGPGEVHVAGMPILRVLMGNGIRNDLRRFMPLGLLIMLVFLFLSFKQLRGMLLPFIVVVLSALFAMGLIPLLGWKIQMITIILPVILLAIANDYGIHLIARYQEVNKPGNTMTSRDLAQNVFSELARPIAIAGLTTMAGLACLGLHIIVPAKQLGLLSVMGILYAVLCSLVLIPAVLSLLPKAKPVVTAAAGQGKGSPRNESVAPRSPRRRAGKARGGRIPVGMQPTSNAACVDGSAAECRSHIAASPKMSLLDRLLAVIARRVSAHPKTILVTFVGISLLVAVGIMRVRVDTNTVHYFPEEHPIQVASKIADKYFGGSTTFSVVLQGDIKHPAALRRLGDLEQKLEALPQVDQSTSIATVIRQMNKTMNNDDPAFDRIPDTREGVAQLLLMYENSGDPEDFDRLVDFGYRHALLTSRINTQSTSQISKVVDFVRGYVKSSAELSAAPRAPSTAKPASQPTSKPAQEKQGEEEDDSPFTMAEDQEAAGSTKGIAAKSTPAKGEPVGNGFGGASRFTMVGGFAVLFTDLVDAVVNGQLLSLGLSLLLVVIIVAVLFRSLTAGLLSGGTLGLAMAILFGLMGLLDIDLNLPTAMLSSIVIGVGVDYTIHFLWRYRDERRAGLDAEEAVFQTLTTTGRGIIINALSVAVGFAIMLVSSFMPVRNFGYLVVVSITACLAGALILMPALVLLFRPKFLQPKADSVK